MGNLGYFTPISVELWALLLTGPILYPSFFPLRLVVFPGCQALSTLGFSVDASDNDDTKPLHLAARFGHNAVVAKLLGATQKRFSQGFFGF